MRSLLCGLTLAALSLAALAVPARADIADLSNGVRLPNKKGIESKWGEPPSDKDLQVSGKGNLKIAYDGITIDGTRRDAAELMKFWVTDAILDNANFASGEKNGASGYWPEAAEAFAKAADGLSGAGKQQAVYKRMLALANADDEDATLKAADDVLTSDEKPYYFGPAEETRARIFARQGKMAQAVDALKKVTDAPGMNVRDYFNAAYLSVWLTKSVSASSPDQFAAAEKAYRGLLQQLDRAPHSELAVSPRLKIMMSLASSVRAQGRAAEAKKLFDQILATTAKGGVDPGILAGVYYGLGDVAYEEASKLQDTAGHNPQQKQQVKDLLDQAALHYLRVVLLYRDNAGQRELFGATRGAARVFATLFTLGDEKDCDLVRRSYDYYVQAYRMLPRGEARNDVAREGKVILAKLKACTGEDKEPAKPKDQQPAKPDDQPSDQPNPPDDQSSSGGSRGGG